MNTNHSSNHLADALRGRPLIVDWERGNSLSPAIKVEVTSSELTIAQLVAVATLMAAAPALLDLAQAVAALDDPAKGKADLDHIIAQAKTVIRRAGAATSSSEPSAFNKSHP